MILEKRRSEEHTSELQSHSEISYAVFCLKKKKALTKTLVLLFKDLHWMDDASSRLLEHLLPLIVIVFFFFFNDTATTEIYTNLNTLSLHDALPICHIQKSRMPSSACDRSEERRVGKEC